MKPKLEQILRWTPTLLLALGLSGAGAAAAAQNAQASQRVSSTHATQAQAARQTGATNTGKANTGKAKTAASSSTDANVTNGQRSRVEKSPKLDRSGHRRVGKASFYARKFTGRKMADGTRMDPADDNAASKTLPLGTTARVTNLETQKSAAVTIQDRGPYVPGRIIDLSPATASEIGITRKEGIAPVEVAPITVPQADGGVKLGAGATGERVSRYSPRNR